MVMEEMRENIFLIQILKCLKIFRSQISLVAKFLVQLSPYFH